MIGSPQHFEVLILIRYSMQIYTLNNCNMHEKLLKDTPHSSMGKMMRFSLIMQEATFNKHHTGRILDFSRSTRFHSSTSSQLAPRDFHLFLSLQNIWFGLVYSTLSIHINQTLNKWFPPFSFFTKYLIWTGLFHAIQPYSPDLKQEISTFFFLYKIFDLDWSIPRYPTIFTRP